MEELKYLSLRPLAPAVQRVAVYETKPVGALEVLLYSIPDF